MYARYGKRLLDIVGASLALLLLSPVLLGIAALVRWRLGSPVLFRQSRPGRGGHIFPMLKFRTMTDARDARGELLPDDQRLTRFGRLLRATSLDELPELWNVLRGEMSLVGPRPLLVRYLPLYSPQQARRHEVRPGITGWAQVNGRNAISWERKFELDTWYVDQVSLWLDTRIVFRTLGKLLGGSKQEINAAGHATAPEFRGSGVAVLGAGGHAKVVIQTLRAAGEHVSAVYDDDSTRWGGTLLGVPIVGPLARLTQDAPPRAVLAIGANGTRLRIAAEHPLDWVVVVHPAAHVDPSARLSPGAVVLAGAVVQADATLGPHTIVNTGASIDHDCRLGAGVHVAPGARLTGDVAVEDGAFIGAGAIVLPGVRVARDAVVGAGAVVLAHVPSAQTVVGAPARPIRRAA